FLDAFQFSVPYLNVGYGLIDGSSIKVSPTSFAFEPTTLIDSLNSTSASFEGSIRHQNFKFFNLDMNFVSPNLFILDTDDSYDNNYYGKAFFNGNARIHGPSQSLTFDLDGSSAEGTNIVIAVDNSGSIEDVSYLKFVDKNAIKNTDNQTSSPSLIKGLTLNFDLSITQDAELELLFDSDTGSTLSGSGVGSILMEINTDGNFNVFGDFIALNGIYQFKNFGILEKEFRLEPGGTILWNGNPLDAQLNLQAIYEVPGGANPAILLENPGLNRKIPTDVKINLTGSIMQLEAPSFTIDFPNTSANVRNDLAYKLDDEERRQIQAISLLSQGVFISDLSLSAITAQALTNNLFQKASGVFESIFSGDEEKLKLGLNYLQGDRNSESIARTRDRLGLTLVTKVSDRLLINGKLGVPFGGVEETIIVGDVTIEFLLSKDGALRARIFNRENEFQYFGDELGYTQGVGLSYQVEFDDFKSLIKKIVKKNAI
ncbi:MAG: translocation/assembly module TamB domain-containing protein, partial [Flavobacteriaceae bacterium]